MEVIKYDRYSGSLSNPSSEVCYYIPDKSLVLVRKEHPFLHLKIEENHRRPITGKVPLYSPSGNTRYETLRIEDLDVDVSELEGIIRLVEEADSLQSKVVENIKNLKSALSQAEKVKVEEN